MSAHAWQPSGFDLRRTRGRRPVSSLIAGVLLAGTLLALIAVSGTDFAPASSAADARELSFVANAGQDDPAVRFAAHASGASFYFTQSEAVMAFERGDEGLALRLGFVGANPAPAIEGVSERAGTVNYLIGNDSAAWRTGVPTFGEVVYRELWPGIDMVFRGAWGTLKYEFVVRPGADPSQIRLAYRGADGLALGAGGQLLIATPLGTLRDEKPRSFQLVDGRRVPVKSRFALAERAGSYGLALGAYDPSRPLVIDPALLYSTYLGGTGAEEAQHVALGPDGSAYVTGYTLSPDFPSSAGAFDPTRDGSSDGFVARFDSDGSLVYATFIGGSSPENGASVAVDATGHAYVAGWTDSSDFPTTPGAHATSLDAAQDGFVMKLSPDGSGAAYSTYLGGTSNTVAVDIDLGSDGSAFVTGMTSGFPTTSGAFDDTISGFEDGLVAKLSPDGSTLVYATYLGGTECDLDSTNAVAVDAAGSAYIVGYTSAADFPTTPGAFDTTSEGCVFADGFVTKLNPSGSALDYSTFLNGESDQPDIGFGVEVDATGNAYVTGVTQSPDFPTTEGAYDRTLGGSTDAFVTTLNATGSDLVFSTFLGGTGSESGTAIALGEEGDVFVSGGTGSEDFPATAGAFDESLNGADDAMLARLDSSGSLLRHATYFGGTGHDFALWGLAVDGAGNALFSGYTESSDLPMSANALDDSYGGNLDGWLVMLATGDADSDGDGIPDDQDIEPIRDRIEALIAQNPGSPAADKLEDSLAKVDSAIAKLAAGDRQGALGELEGAVGDVEAAVNGGNLDTTVGTDLMRDLAAFARIIATQAIDAAKARNGNAGKIAEAEAARAEGDARVAADRFKEAVGKYKDAVAKAESA